MGEEGGRRSRRRGAMCEHCPETPDAPSASPTVPRPDRRAVLSGLLALPVGVGAATTAASTADAAAATVGQATGAPRLVRAPGLVGQAAPQPPIVRRAEWGGDLSPRGALPTEDVRFLLVHHTAEPGSDYQPGEVPGLLRGIYRFHTGASKGWPDVAYNFFVDRFGTIYEGRTGSVDGPVRGSATGGNQGYSQLCCFVGNFEVEAPPAPALASMYSLLAWLADRYRVDTSPGATVTFTSMGSNRWPAGSTVEAATISAHRDMSQTTCPGSACYSLVRSTFPQEVTARRGTPVATPPTDTTAETSTTTSVPTTTAAPTSTAPSRSETPASAPTTSPSKVDGDRAGEIAVGTAGASGGAWPIVAGVAVLGAAAAGAVAVARRRPRCGGDPSAAVSIVWRTADGTSDPLLDALAISARPIVAAGGEWWDELGDHWRVSVPVGGATTLSPDGVGPIDPASFLVASDGERALVRLAGDASGTATLRDGSTSELAPNGVTKVWLSSASIRLVVGSEPTEVFADGTTGPVDHRIDAASRREGR